MDTTNTNKRESINLTTVVIITIVFILFSLSVDFINRIQEYFLVYTTLPIGEYFINLVFLWLLVTLWVTYKRWKKAAKSQKELEGIISSIHADVLVVVDNDRHIIKCNASVKRMFGYDMEEVINRKIDFLYSDSCSDISIRDEITDKLERDGFYIGLATGKKKNGDTLPLEIITGNRSDHNGAVLLLRDITERKMAEETLQKAYDKLEHQVEDRTAELVKANGQLEYQIVERRLAEEVLKNKMHVLNNTQSSLLRSKEFSNRIIEAADVLIIGFDLDRKVTLFNRKAEEVTGYLRSEVIGKDFIRTILQKKKEPALARMCQEIAAGKNISPRDITFINKNGEERIIYSQVSALKNDKNEITGVLGIGSDVTELRNIQQTTIQSEKLRSLGVMAGGVAHNFNNVLASILGTVQLLKMHLELPTGEEKRRKSMIELKKGLEVIEKASRDVAGTVQRIQEFSQTREDDKCFTTVDLNEIIEDALEFTRVIWKDDAEAKGIKINIHKEVSILPSTLGSAGELREVLINLINNAVDAMPQGGSIKIKTSKEDSHITIRVEDTGTGIPKAFRDRIFDPFYTTKGVQSTGLGMSVSYGIISRHRGTITVESIEGKGTTFTVKLPISKKTIETEQEKSFSGEQRKAKILVIDDEEDVRNLISAILIKGGHEVETAASGKHGIELFSKKGFDLVFTDLGMADMSGWQLAEEIKGINRRVPTVLVTGWNVKLNESEVNNSWVDFVIHKPFEANQLLRLTQESMILRDHFKTS